MSRAGFNAIVAAIVGAMLAGLSGCSLLAPGLDTRTATEQKSKTVWDAQDSLWIDQSTTHNQRTVAAEGESVTLEFHEDGSPKSITGGTHVLSQCSEPKDVAGAYMHLADRNAEVAGKITDMLSGMMSQVIPLMIQNRAPTISQASQAQQLLSRFDPDEVDMVLGQTNLPTELIDWIRAQLAASRRATAPATAAAAEK